MTDSMIAEVIKQSMELLPEYGLEEFICAVRYTIRHLHPAQLGILLVEIQAAKETRYSAPHPDYYNALNCCLKRERKPKQKIARFDERMLENCIEDFKQAYEEIEQTMRAKMF